MKRIIKNIMALCLILLVSVSVVPALAASAENAAATSQSAVLTLGNNRWVTSGASYNGMGKYMLSWDYSVVNATFSKPAYYKGCVWNTEETEKYDAVIWVHNNEIVVDTTTCRAAMYVDTSDTTFIIKKADAFSIVAKTDSAQPDVIYSEKDYLVTCTLDTSLITIKDLGATGGVGVDEDAPVIKYEGDAVLYAKAGNCVPLIIAKAEDLADGDVLVKTVWSDGTFDDNYKLIAGTHTAVLTATDKAGKTAELTVRLIVSDKK